MCEFTTSNSNRLRMTSLGGHGEIASRHDSGVVQLNLAQDEVVMCLLVFHTLYDCFSV